jgi:5-methylcytosine-specific restriction endonuclease McrA
MAKLYGADNPAYRGGVTNLRSLIRTSKMYKEWKKLIFQRDRYKCVDCGVVGDHKSLEAHHTPLEFADLLQEFLKKFEGKYSLPKDERRLFELSQLSPLLWSVRNGVSLCASCHKKRHADLKEKAKNVQ